MYAIRHKRQLGNLRWNTTNLHHVRRFIDCPNHDILPSHLTFLSEPGKFDQALHIEREAKGNTNFWPSAVVSDANEIENAWQSCQKYFLAIATLYPIYERRQYGKRCFANGKNRGCQSPKRIRGARVDSQFGWEIMMSCISVNNLSGSFWILTSTLNLTCWFSG